MKLPDTARFNTVCIHAGQVPDPSTGAIITPIYQTSTYVQDALGQHKGYEYGRTQNPTRSALEGNLAAMENGKAAFAFASGMAATGAVMTLLQAGDHVVVTDNTYGGTYRLFERVLRKYQLDFTYVDTSSLDAIESAIRPATKMLFIETPTNPTLRLTDLTAASAIGRGHDLIVVVDNTFASPYGQRPIDFGADIVVHSTTKFLNGHSDSIGGVAVAVRDEHVEWLRFVQNAEGAILGPMDAWLVLRGTKTLPIRMERHNANAQTIAEFLDCHPKVPRVHYPGLPSHPHHALAQRQMRGFGGVISFELGSLEKARTFLNHVSLVALAESLGGVETLISHPASMTHASVPEDRRVAMGLTDDMVRLSVGIEDVDDLKDDLLRRSSAYRRGRTPRHLPARRRVPDSAGRHLWRLGVRDSLPDHLCGNRAGYRSVSSGRFAAVRGRRAGRGGALDIGGLALLLIVAAISGDAVNYTVGRAVGTRVIQLSRTDRRWGRWIQPAYIARAHEFFERHGGKAIVLARFVPIVRTFVPFVAGAAEMSYRAFALYNVTGGVAWVGICLGAGYVFGNVPVVKENFSLVALGIVIISVLPMVFEYMKYRREGRAS